MDQSRQHSRAENRSPFFTYSRSHDDWYNEMAAELDNYRQRSSAETRSPLFTYSGNYNDWYNEITAELGWLEPSVTNEAIESSDVHNTNNHDYQGQSTYNQVLGFQGSVNSSWENTGTSNQKNNYPQSWMQNDDPFYEYMAETPLQMNNHLQQLEDTFENGNNYSYGNTDEFLCQQNMVQSDRYLQSYWPRSVGNGPQNSGPGVIGQERSRNKFRMPASENVSIGENGREENSQFVRPTENRQRQGCQWQFVERNREYSHNNGQTQVTRSHSRDPIAVKTTENLQRQEGPSQFVKPDYECRHNNGRRQSTTSYSRDPLVMNATENRQRQGGRSQFVKPDCEYSHNNGQRQVTKSHSREPIALKTTEYRQRQEGRSQFVESDREYSHNNGQRQILTSRSRGPIAPKATENLQRQEGRNQFVESHREYSINNGQRQVTTSHSRGPIAMKATENRQRQEGRSQFVESDREYSHNNGQRQVTTSHSRGPIAVNDRNNGERPVRSKSTVSNRSDGRSSERQGIQISTTENRRINEGISGGRQTVSSPFGDTNHRPNYNDNGERQNVSKYSRENIQENDRNPDQRQGTQPGGRQMVPDSRGNNGNGRNRDEKRRPRSQKTHRTTLWERQGASVSNTGEPTINPNIHGTRLKIVRTERDEITEGSNILKFSDDDLSTEQNFRKSLSQCTECCVRNFSFDLARELLEFARNEYNIIINEFRRSRLTVDSYVNVNINIMELTNSTNELRMSPLFRDLRRLRTQFLNDGIRLEQSIATNQLNNLQREQSICLCQHMMNVLEAMWELHHEYYERQINVVFSETVEWLVFLFDVVREAIQH